MKPISVYRVDYVRKTRVKIGTVVERRAVERGDNMHGLLFLARKRFASSPQEAFLTALDRGELMAAQAAGGQAPPPQ